MHGLEMLLHQALLQVRIFVAGDPFAELPDETAVLGRHAPIALTRLWKDRSMLRWLTAGESHGPELVAILEGLPAGIPVSLDAIRADLARRKLGYGRGARMKFEQDELAISGGVRHGVSLGSPVALRIGNTEWPKWQEVMSPEPIDPAELGRGRGAPLTRPRPGHADLVGMQKYGFDEARPVLERASARETAARVALGAVARAFLAELGIRLVATRSRSAPCACPRGARCRFPTTSTRSTPIRCAASTPRRRRRMVAEVDAAHKDGDTLGGVVEVLAYGLPPGLGSHVHWDRRLDSQLAAALMGIQAIKGVEVGDGFLTTTRRGSAAHDELAPGRRPHRARERPRRRHRGRHVHRHRAARPRRHEADRDDSARPAARSTSPPARPHRPTTSDPMSARFPRPASSPRRWSRSRSRTPCSRSSAATPSVETRRNLESYLAAIPDALRTAGTSAEAAADRV